MRKMSNASTPAAAVARAAGREPRRTVRSTACLPRIGPPDPTPTGGRSAPPGPLAASADPSSGFGRGIGGEQEPRQTDDAAGGDLRAESLEQGRPSALVGDPRLA